MSFHKNSFYWPIVGQAVSETKKMKSNFFYLVESKNRLYKIQLTQTVFSEF